MNVTKEEMELLQMILNNDCSPNGEAIKLANLWRKRGVTISEFQLLTEEKFPLASSSHPSSSPPLHSPSLSPRSSPSSSLFKEGVQGTKKLKLTSDLILASVPIDLTLCSSPSFLVAWKSWVESRLQFKPLPTLLAFERHMSTCARLGESRAIAAIEHSIANSYRAIFEPYSARSAKPDNRDRVGASL